MLRGLLEKPIFFPRLLKEEGDAGLREDVKQALAKLEKLDAELAERKAFEQVTADHFWLKQKCPKSTKKNDAADPELRVALLDCCLVSQRRIKLLHFYNETKDATGDLFGKLAEATGGTIKDLYSQHGLTQ